MRELTIALEQRGKMPLYEQIYQYIRQEIREGRIGAGERLPSARSLSSYLEVSRSTVDLAYAQLLSEGYIEAVPRKGYYACGIENLYHWPEEGIRAFGSIAGEQWKAGEKAQKEPIDYDFLPDGIDKEGFPRSIWTKLTRNVLLDAPPSLFYPGEPGGEWELRESICRYLYEARGVVCTPEQVIVGAGNDYLLLLLGSLLGNNRKIAMESPTYLHAHGIFKELGFSMCTVPMDMQGMDPEALRRTGADTAYIMPSHQYPMGLVMPIKRRLELLQWAGERKGRFLIEDDYDSEFRYRGKPVPALQGADEEGKVIYLGTFSKSLSPALRISYLVLPLVLLEKLSPRLSRFSCTVSRIDQRVLAEFIREGYLGRHLNRMRSLYGRKHDLLLGELKSLPCVSGVSGEYAGLHMLAEFREGREEQELAERAKAVRVKVYPLSEYQTEESRFRKAGMLFGYGSLSEGEIREAVGRLREAWK